MLRYCSVALIVFAVWCGSAHAAIIHTGNFTEYTMPAGVLMTDADIANGPLNSNTLWFPACSASTTFNIPAKVYRLSAGTGALAAFAAPSTYTAETTGPSCNFSFAGGSFWYFVDNQSASLHLLSRVSTSGAFLSFTPIVYLLTTRLIPAPNGMLWFGMGLWERCFQTGQTLFNGRYDDISTTGALGFNDGLPVTVPCNPFVRGTIIAHGLTVGPDNNVYIVGQDSVTERAMVVKVSPLGSILASYGLPLNSFPTSIAVGPDHNLWIAENGAHKIARMTTQGVATQYSPPNGVAFITAVPQLGVLANGALWFTIGTNRLGRITTSGIVTEYQVPNTAAVPWHIVPCPTTVCGVHGGVWFTEQGLNRVARFSFSQ